MQGELFLISHGREVRVKMDNEERAVKTMPWVLAMVCMAAIIFSLCGGAAFTAVKDARLSAARASIGQIEAVLLLAEKSAQENNYGAPPAVYQNVLKSYDDGAGVILSDYERYVLKTMLDSFGTARSFDFAITRYQQGNSIYTQVYYFPVRGRTDVRTDRYYLMEGSSVTEKNG